jgi:DNA-binding CsgD family transcriptional regulator
MDKKSVTLTEREEEILQLLCNDLSLQAIADELHISYHTVQFHVKSLKTKYDVKTLHGLVVAFKK